MKFVRFKSIKSGDDFSLNVSLIKNFYPKKFSNGSTYTLIKLIDDKEFLVFETFDQVFDLVNRQ
ncbi:hypothetical protein QQY79_18385 [Flavobacterium tructae]|uniref:hypothetical protein n=1 Tax=Flavobacterium tructae TaxID=1114873 RepID=UPI002551FC25|nr:hypothetical protein [Flavobacterium tructae]MDL2144501.1 hypothetical protein [Flavobacterium tructae]